MTKQQFKNLWSSFRWMSKRTTYEETIAWIAHYNVSDSILIRRLTS